MKTVIRTLLAVAGLGLAGAAAVVFGGLYDVSARHGHLPGVSWVLHTTFRNSVQLRARPMAEVPPLTDQMAALGARHYDASCRHCHASPGETATQTMRAMVPHPPHITDAVADWKPNELGWIVYHGVKMSGMPQWPAPREDEVWAVVAFLDRVSQMSEAAYEDLTAQPQAELAGLSYCASCHGLDGHAPNPQVPRLDILDRPYLDMSLEAFLGDLRHSGIMQHAVTEVPPEALDPLAEHYAAQPLGPAAAQDLDPALVARGQLLAEAQEGDDVPACRSCHGPWPDKLRDEFPSLSGQHEPYLRSQLKAWRDGHRGGGPVSELMREAAEDLEDADIDALAAYYASLPPARLSR
ncbi:c-type cytochrome [Paracoccus rhizosphaerae]|uniref:C-type cytochrome n=1 Tax=Paracoccus rhizosphaerae TaxID=1133347 RepID=A0ABV6CIP5_9RHOB|nr:c-type cytochrome [Paracoccus rhizosphaerae]